MNGKFEVVRNGAFIEEDLPEKKRTPSGKSLSFNMR